MSIINGGINLFFPGDQSGFIYKSMVRRNTRVMVMPVCVKIWVRVFCLPDQNLVFTTLVYCDPKL